MRHFVALCNYAQHSRQIAHKTRLICMYLPYIFYAHSKYTPCIYDVHDMRITNT